MECAVRHLDGQLEIRVGPSTIRLHNAVAPHALELRGESLYILREAGNRYRRGLDPAGWSWAAPKLWRKVPAAVAAELRAMGIRERDTTRRSGAKWERGTFEVHAKLDKYSAAAATLRKVEGWRWGGYGIALHWLDDDGAAVMDDWRQPPRALTHLRSGMAVVVGGSIANLKRAAEEVQELAPELAGNVAADIPEDSRRRLREWRQERAA